MKKYIFGLLTGLLFIPIIEELLNVILAWIEWLKIFPSKLVVKGNKELSELQSNEEYTQTNVIGFTYDPQDDCDNYEE